MGGNWKPEGHTSVSAYLVVENGIKEIEFLQKVFGAVILSRTDRPDGSLGHTELRIDDSVIMLSEGVEGWPPIASHVHVYVPDVDVVYRRAMEFGAISLQDPLQKDDRDKRAGFTGPGGIGWWVGTRQSSH